MLFRAAGWFAIMLFVLTFLAWLQNADPDCYLSTGVSLQIRMCNDQMTGATSPKSFMGFLAPLLALCAGILLLRSGRFPEEPDKEE